MNSERLNTAICIFILSAIFAAQGLASHGNQAGEDLLHRANSMVKNIEHTTYSHKIYIDESKGIYKLDCSGFISYLLNETRPTAQAAIPHPGQQRPLAEDFYRYFKGLSKSPNKAGWSKVEYATDLNAGDIIAWLQPASSEDSGNTGHVMIVGGKPSVNSDRKKEVLVPVIDSTSSPHSDDSRRKGSSGLGKGTIGILTNDKAKPVGFFWRGGLSEKPNYTKIAFGRMN